MNYLSSNIRFLRKQRKLSQQQLADDLGVKRSNIAAYETKNVEPRLSLISALAKYFDTTLEEFIANDLQAEDSDRIEYTGRRAPSGPQRISSDAVQEIEQLSDKIQRMLEGFKVFYEFKLSSREAEGEKPGDIDNFLVFIDHMSEYNALIEANLRSGRSSREQPEVDGSMSASYSAAG